MWFRLPTTYYLRPTTDYRQEQRRLNACRKEHAYNAYREEHLSERSICPLTVLVGRSMLTMRIERSICPLTMLVKRSMLTMRIERSICPLTMLVERSMLTMRIERSICPLTRWMFATILVRRRLWSFLERLNLSQYWTLQTILE